MKEAANAKPHNMQKTIDADISLESLFKCFPPASASPLLSVIVGFLLLMRHQDCTRGHESGLVVQNRKKAQPSSVHASGGYRYQVQSLIKDSLNSSGHWLPKKRHQASNLLVVALQIVALYHRVRSFVDSK